MTVTLDGGTYYAVMGVSSGCALPLVNMGGVGHDGAATMRMSGSTLSGDWSVAVMVVQASRADYPGFVTCRANVIGVVTAYTP